MSGKGTTAVEAAGWQCHDDHCVTCSDAGEAMRVVRVDDARGLALCTDAGGERRTIEIALVAPVAPDDELLVHAGTAIASLRGREAGE